MANEYLIGLGLDGDKLFKNFKDTIAVLEQVESKSGEVGNSMNTAFEKGVQASNEFDKKLQNTSKHLDAIKEMGKMAGKELADAMSGKGINSSEFEKKISSFKEKLSSMTAKVDVKLDDEKVRIFQKQIDGAKNDVEELNVALKISKDVLASMDTNSQEYKDLSDAINFTESALKEFETGVVAVVEKVKPMKSELRQLNQELQRMEANGEGGSEQFLQMSVRAGELKDQIGDTAQQIAILASDTKHFDAMISGVTGLVGAFTAVQGAVGLFGAENEELEKALLKVNSAMALLQGLQAVSDTLNKDSAFSVIFLRKAREGDAIATRAQTGATLLQALAMNGATLATKALRIGLASIGIGLIIALVAYLVANWDKLKASMEKLLPATKDSAKAWNGLKAVFLGVGTALVEYVIAPMKIAIALFTEGLDSAVQQAKKSYDVLGNYEKEHKQQTIKNAEEMNLELKKKRMEAWDSNLKIQEAEGKDTFASRQKLYKNKIAIAKKEGADSKELTQELLEFEARKRGEDRKKAEENAKKRAEDANKRAEDANKRAEDAKKKAEENAKKALELQQRQNDQIKKFADELKNSEIATIEDKTKKARKELEKQLDDKIKAIEDEKALTKTAEETQTQILINLRKDKATKLNEFDSNALKERFKMEIEANKEIASLKKESLDTELDLLMINSQLELDAINEKYKNEENIRLQLIEETEKKLAEKGKEIKNKYALQSLKEDEERSELGIELSATYANKSEKTETQKQIALLNVKAEFARRSLELLLSQGADENSLEVLNAEKVVKDTQDAVNGAVAGNNGKDFDFMDFLGIGEGLEDGERERLKKAINQSMEVLKDFTSFMIDNIDQKMEKKQEERAQTQEEIDDLEDKLEEEKELRDNGFANNVELIEAELAEKQKEKDEQIRQEEALLEKKKAMQKVQLAMDTASQLSGLVSASVDIWKGFMAASPFLAPLAVGVIGLMFGSFVASKAKALQSINQQKVSYGEGGEISGRSHAQGGEKYYNADGSKVRELEDGEFVVRKKQYKKFNSLVKAINNDDFSNLSINDYAISEMFRSLGFDFNTGVDEARNLQLTLMTMGYSSGESKHLAEISNGIAQLVDAEKNTPKSWSDGVFNYLKDGGKIRKTRIIPLKIEDEN